MDTKEYAEGFDATLRLVSEEPWAIVSLNGKLTRFDNQTCRRLAEEYKAGEHDQNRAIACLCAALLDKAADNVSHIVRAGGGTYGDALRGLAVMTPNAEVKGDTK